VGVFDCFTLAGSCLDRAVSTGVTDVEFLGIRPGITQCRCVCEEGCLLRSTKGG